MSIAADMKTDLANNTSSPTSVTKDTTIHPTYSTTLYNSLPTLYAARTWFDESSALTVIHNALGRLIKQYSYHHLFGIGLLHRHFLLIDPQAKMVEFSMTSSPWTITSDPEALAHGHIVPAAWMIVSGSLVPYEFVFVPFGEDVEEVDFTESGLHSSFARDFVQTVTGTPGLEKILGLRRYAGHEAWGAVEITQEYSNVLLRPEQVPPHIRATAVEASWFFDPKAGYRQLACSSYCRSHFKTDN